jgi:hypothetical protein
MDSVIVHRKSSCEGLNGRPFHNGNEDFVKIDTMSLLETMSNQSGLQMRWLSIYSGLVLNIHLELMDR